MKRFFSIIIFGLTLHPAFAQDEDAFDVRVKGFVDTYQAVQTDKPNKWMSSRTRARGEVTIEKGTIQSSRKKADFHCVRPTDIFHSVTGI